MMSSEQQQSDEPPGVLVESVAAASQASSVGLLVGDVLLTYNGIPLLSPAHLQALEENTIGEESIVLKIVRSAEARCLTVPTGALGMQVRPLFSAEVLNLYEMAKQMREGGQNDSWLQRMDEAARLAMKIREPGAASWLWTQVGKGYEQQYAWSQAQEVYEQILDLIGNNSPYLKWPSRSESF